MKKQFGLIFGLMTVLALSGCGKEVEVSDFPIDLPGMNSDAKVGVSGQLYSGIYGQIQFAQVNQGVVQVLRNCSYDSAWCSSGFQLTLNDSNSIYSRSLSDGSTAQITATGSLDRLVLSTSVKNWRYTEIFVLSDNPCGESKGKGLEATWIKTEFVQGGTSETETCHAYY